MMAKSSMPSGPVVELCDRGGIRHLVALSDVALVLVNGPFDHRKLTPGDARERGHVLHVLEELARVGARRIEIARRHLRINLAQEIAVGVSAREALRQLGGIDAGGL